MFSLTRAEYRMTTPLEMTIALALMITLMTIALEDSVVFSN